MLRQILPYVRGALFCVFLAPALGAAIGFVLVPVVGAIAGFFYVLAIFGIQITICAPIGVYIALRAAKRGDSLRAIKRRMACVGALFGGLVGLTSALSTNIYTWEPNPYYFKSKPDEFWPTVFRDLLSWNSQAIVVLGAIFGIIVGYFLPSALGAAFRTKLSDNHKPTCSCITAQRQRLE